MVKIIKKNLPFFVFLFFLLYFCFNLLSGERGLISYYEKEKEYYVKPNEKKHRKNQELIRTRKNEARKAAAAEMRRKQSSSWR